MKSLLATLLALACAFSANAAMELKGMTAHNEAGVSCQDCHGQQQNIDRPASQQQCLACHANVDGYYYGELQQQDVGKYFEYQEGGKPRQASFHDSHVGHVRCTVCHMAHQEPSIDTLYCNYCHQFDVTMK